MKLLGYNHHAWVLCKTIVTVALNLESSYDTINLELFLCVCVCVDFILQFSISALFIMSY